MKTIAILCFTLATIGCAADAVDDTPGRDRDVSGAVPAEPGILSMTAEEVIKAPGGHLSVAPLTASDDNESGCQAEAAVAVRIADGTAPNLKIASLCTDAQAGDEVVLRGCRAGETPISERGVSSLTDRSNAWGTPCYWCTSDHCSNNWYLPQRKEGTTFWCPSGTCCWASNGGCCS